MPDLNIIPVPKCPDCEGIAHPHILFFDESYDEAHYQRDTIRDLMIECDCLVVIGTKLETGMSNGMVRDGLKKNINIIEINPEPIIKIGKTFTLKGNAEDFVPQICKRTI